MVGSGLAGAAKSCGVSEEMSRFMVMRYTG